MKTTAHRPEPDKTKACHRKSISVTTDPYRVGSKHVMLPKTLLLAVRNIPQGLR